MVITKYLTEQKILLILKPVKILFIIFTSIFLILNFTPFFYGVDSYLYGVATVGIVNGSYEYTNELLKQTGSDLFLPGAWTLTDNNAAIPTSSVGIFGFSSISYLLGGYYGLFYLGPLFAILLIIISERIATKLFGEIAGFVTLIIVGTDSILLKIGLNLLTDNIFTLFFILGCFYLIKFFKNKTERNIFLSSTFFVIATFVRVNGIISFPIELIVLSFFAFRAIKDENNNFKFISRKLPKLIFSKIKSRKFFKYSVLILLPWFIFFIFWFSFNEYYFGDPTANYREPDKNKFFTGYSSAILNLNENRFEWIKFFSVGLLPDYLELNLLQMVDYDVKSDFYRNISFMVVSTILVSALTVSLYERKMRTEIILMTFLVLGVLIFYSARFDNPSQSIYATQAIQTRYVLSGFILSTMILGYLITKILKMRPKKIPNVSIQKFFQAVRFGILGIVILFLFFSFYDNSRPIQAMIYSNYQFNDPEEFVNRYPLDLEGLSENNIVFWGGHKSVEYNLIPLNPKIPIQLRFEWNPNLIPLEPIEAIKKLDNEGYKIYTFKDDVTDIQRTYYQFLEKEQGIILKEYSKTFCQMKIIGIENIGKNESSISDGKCYWTPKKVNVLHAFDELP